MPRAGPARRTTAARTTGLLRNLVVREGRRTGELQVRLVHRPRRDSTAALAAAVDCDGLMWTRTDALAETTLGGDTSLDRRRRRALEEELAACASRSRRYAFFQTNTEMAERLYGDRRRARGAGGLGARLRPLLRDRHGRPGARGARRRGVGPGDRRGGGRRRDRQRAAQRDLATRASSPATCASRCASSSTRRAARTSCVVDPPRAGLSQKVVRRIIEAAPRRIVYISCNPTTLAPNAAQLVEAGYVAASASRRSTCSRRRRTSSASRCSTGRSMCYKWHMRSIGIRELRQQASKHLRDVERGETIEVTDRGRPVALLVPVPRGGTAARLIAEGRMTKGTGTCSTSSPSSPCPASRCRRRSCAACARTSADGLVYLDSSAIVKLVVEEPESARSGIPHDRAASRASCGLARVRGARAPSLERGARTSAIRAGVPPAWTSSRSMPRCSTPRATSTSGCGASTRSMSRRRGSSATTSSAS